jgi:hypothetical protein
MLPCQEHDIPEGARFCIQCGKPVAAEGKTERLDRPLLGLLRGEPIYEYDDAIWCDPAFVVVNPFLQD